MDQSLREWADRCKELNFFEVEPKLRKAADELQRLASENKSLKIQLAKFKHGQEK